MIEDNVRTKVCRCHRHRDSRCLASHVVASARTRDDSYTKQDKTEKYNITYCVNTARLHEWVTELHDVW